MGASVLLPGIGLPLAAMATSAVAGTAGMVGNAIATDNIVKEAKGTMHK